MFTIENFISYEVVQKIGWVLLHFIWQAAVIAMVMAVILRIMRRFSANLRYIVACLTLLIIVVLPFITMQFIKVSTPPAAAKIIPDTIEPVITNNEVSFETPAAEPAKVVYVQPEPVISEHRINWQERVVTFLEPKLPHIVTIWLFGVLALSIWHLGGYAQLQKLRSKMVKQVDSSLNNKIKILAQKLGVKQAVQLLESALVQIPTVVGWLKPVILLPASAMTGLTAEQLEAILAHELAHIKRYDYLVNILQIIVEILGFYHPAVWWISHKIRCERENCCDDLAVAVCGDRINYAKALTSLEEIRGRDQLAIAATGGNLFSRICRLLGKDSSEKNALSWIPALTVILFLIALAIPTTIAFTSNNLENDSETQVNKDENWGDAVDGVRCHVQAEKTSWIQGSIPKFSADIKNHGQRNLRIAIEHESWEVEIDGKWFKTNNYVSGDRRYLPLETGQQQRNLTVQIISFDNIGQALGNLEPGKHNVRVARLLNSTRNPGEETLRIVSNPIEIEILPENENTSIQVEPDKSVNPNDLKIYYEYAGLESIDLSGNTLTHIWHTLKVDLVARRQDMSSYDRHEFKKRLTESEIALFEYWCLESNLFALPSKIPDSGESTYGSTFVTTFRVEHNNRVYSTGWTGDSVVPVLVNHAVQNLKDLCNRIQSKSAAQIKSEQTAEKHDNDTQWGQDVNGLRASVEFIPDKVSYSLGERIGIRFNIQNVSSKEIQIAYSELLDSYAEITNSRGEDVSIPSPYGVATGFSRTARVNLKPNETIKLNNFGLGFGRQDDPALVKELTTDPNDFTTREYNKLEPDQYSIQYNVLLPDVTIKSIYEQENVPRLDDWQGTLKSQIKKINITEKPTADPKRFELVLEKQSIQQAVHQLAQKYKARICFEEIENTAALNPNQYLLTGDFYAPTLSEFLNKLTDNGLYDWDKINNTYVVYPKAGSILKYAVKQINLSFSLLGDPLKEIIRQAPEGMKFDFKIDPDISLPRYISYTLNIAEYDAMYALCRTLESTNKCIVWTLTHNNGNHLITLDYMPPTSLSISDDKEILPAEKPNDIKNNTGSDTVLIAEEKILENAEHSDVLFWQKFLNRLDSQISKLKADFPQLADWNKEQIATDSLITGKETTATRITYYHAAFSEKSPGSQNWCEKNGCYIFVKLSTGLESPYINTSSIRLTSRLSVLSTVITGQPENTELEKKINEVIDSVAASITQPEEENTTEQQKSAWQDYTAISNDLYKGVSREEIAQRYLKVANKYPDTKSGRISLELGKLLEQMAKEDKNFVQPLNIETLSDQQKIYYYIFKVRDVAEQEMFVPGKCFVLRDARTANSAAVALRKMGMVAIPSMILLLTDHRPTRSYGQELNGGVVLRYCDVALEILGDIAQPHETNPTAFFDPRTVRGTYLSTADEKTAAEIINKVTLWRQQNKSRVAAETIDEQTAQQTTWGQAVDGVQVRLKADKSTWKAEEIPKLKADVRNNGSRELLIYRTDQLCELSINGQLYQQKEIHAKSSPFPPGKQYDGIEITLDRRWYKNGVDESLQLSPDKHTIQVTFMLNDSRNGLTESNLASVIVKSNPVEIEILPDKEQSEYKKTLASGVTVELIGMCEYPSLGKTWYKPDGKLLENPPYDGSILSILSSNMIDSVPIEFAFRLTGDFNEPAWETQVKTNNDDFVWWTGRRSKNGEFVRDIKSIGMYVKLNRESINLRLGFSIDGKPQEWTEFNNISVKNIVQANDNVQSQIKRIMSAQNLKQLALAVFMYANDNDEKLPEKLDTLKPYFKDENVFLWNLENVKYIGEGTLSRPNAANIPIAFDYKLQDSNSTNFLFLDGHVAFRPTESYQDFLVSKKHVLIEMKYLEVGEDFLEKTNFKEAGIDANPNIGTMAILDDSQQALFLKAVKADVKSRIFNIPSLTVLDKETAKPVIEQIPDVATCEIKTLVMSKQNIVLTISLRIGEMAGHGASISNEEVSLKVWKIQFASTEYVSNGKTWVINIGEIRPDENNSSSPEEKKRIIVLVKPFIIIPEKMETQSHVDNGNDTDMIGTPANEFIINTTEETLPVNVSKKQVLIKMSYLEITENFLKETLNKEILNRTKTAIDPNIWTQVTLDDSQQDTLLQAVRESTDSKILATPSVLIFDNQQASIAIVNKLPIVTGFTEPINSDEKAAPIIEQRDIGLISTVTPHLTPDNKNFVIELKLENRKIIGNEERVFNGKYKEIVPKIWQSEMRTSISVPAGKILLINTGDAAPKAENESGSQQEKKKLMVMLEPAIVQSEQIDNQNPIDNSNDTDMIGAPANEFIINIPRNEQPNSTMVNEIVQNSWQAKFDSIYSLKEGEVLKRIPSFIPERHEYLLQNEGEDAVRDNIDQHSAYVFLWDGNLVSNSQVVGGGSMSISIFLKVGLGLNNYEFDDPSNILRTIFAGDWIIRKNASAEEVLAALEKIFKDEKRREIKFTKQKVEDEVIIAKGRYNFQPLPNISDKKYVLISTRNTDIYLSGGGGGGTISKFLIWVGNRIKMNIIDNTESKETVISWRDHDSSSIGNLDHNNQTYNTQLDMLLNNLSKQTGLTFERTKTDVEKWRITENKKMLETATQLLSNQKPYENNNKTQLVKEQEKPEQANDNNMVQRTYDIGDLVYYSARKSKVKVSNYTFGPMSGSGGISNQTLADAAKELVKQIAESVEPNSWYDNNNKAKGTMYPYPEQSPRKLAVTNTPEVHTQIENFLSSLRESIDNTQVAIELRYLYAGEQSLNEIQKDTGIEKIDNVILNDTQVESLLRATQSNKNIKSLLAPRTTVLNGETAMFTNMGQQSISLDQVNSLCKITPQVSHDKNNVIIDFISRMSLEQNNSNQLANVDEISLSDITIPDKQTFAFSKIVNNQTSSSGDKQLLIVLVRPTIILQEEAEALGERGMGGSMIINSEAAPRRISGQSLNSQPQENTGKVLIETQILHVSNEFLKLVGLDANSLKTSDTWSKYHVKDSSDPNIFIIDQLSADLFQKTIESHKDVKVIAKPAVIAAAGKDANIKVLKEDYYLIGSGTKSDFATEDLFDKDKKEKIETLKNNRELIKLTGGTSFNMKPEILSDNNIQLELKINIGDVISPEEELIINNVTVSDGTPAKNSNYSIPKEVTLINKSVNILIPSKQTLLIIGNKITEGIRRESKTPILGDLPILNRVFINRSYIKDEYIQLFLIKPTIISPEESEKIRTEPEIPIESKP
jgi:prepilin-type processing-associated H-X9-DG protein